MENEFTAEVKKRAAQYEHYENQFKVVGDKPSQYFDPLNLNKIYEQNKTLKKDTDINYWILHENAKNLNSIAESLIIGAIFANSLRFD